MPGALAIGTIAVSLGNRNIQFAFVAFMRTLRSIGLPVLE